VIPGPSVAWLEGDSLDVRDDWRRASAEVRRAYERWRGCGPAEGGRAFAAYRAALDREECAARDYRLESRKGRSGRVPAARARWL
jgi:hypothetical protein